MPVIFVKKEKAKEAKEAKEAPAPKSQETSVKPSLSKSLKVGDSTIIPDLDVHDVQGKTKFMVHKFKPIWFRVVAADLTSNHLKLSSIHGTAFDSKLDGAVSRNYMVIITPEGTKEPSKEIVKKIQELALTTPGEK